MSRVEDRENGVKWKSAIQRTQITIIINCRQQTNSRILSNSSLANCSMRSACWWIVNGVAKRSDKIWGGDTGIWIF